MLYIFKFLLVSQFLSVLTYTNHSKIIINSSINNNQNFFHPAALGTETISSISSINSKFARAKKKIRTEFHNKFKYEYEGIITEVYESEDELWILYDDFINMLTLYIFEIEGRYMNVYEYELSERQLKKLLDKKKKVNNNYFIEII